MEKKRISGNAVGVLQTRRSIEKVLEWENSRLYHKVRPERSNRWSCVELCSNTIKPCALLYLFAVVFALETK